ncbi:APC family permease [Legionella impletisoli]|uniref:Transporter n=1 Tax=Legionella impletisoli TaxID=343510 RepID=A0A917NAR8_9GAMM|nr:APC family permease [Legionella impletisoli]GGI82413.1 transporter [Legionella impletisoli]
MNKTASSAKISILALVLLITGAIDSIRNLPGTALFGSSLIFFFILSALFFLIPVALVSAELASKFPEEEGGVYSWVKSGLGENIAFFAIWLQWINTMIWYPAILSFIAGTLAHLINPALALNKIYIISVILIAFWTLTYLGLNGLKASARFASFCAIFGLILPMVGIVVFSLIWLLQGKPIVIDLSWQSIMPDWSNTQSWVSLTAIMTSFLGMELAAVHVRNIENPRQNYPKAMLYSSLLILSTMILGALAIACVVPKKDISLVDGVMQAFDHFLFAYHLNWLSPVMASLLLLGCVGSMINWIISPAKGLLIAANHGYLPQGFYKLNEHGIASRILLMQAGIVTLLCFCFLLLPSVNAIYWLFADLSTELYIMMYVLLFIAAIFLKKQKLAPTDAFVIPGGHIAYYVTCVIGLIGCLITLAVGFIPPEQTIGASAIKFQTIFSLGILCMFLPAFGLLLRKIRNETKIEPSTYIDAERNPMI